MARVVTLARATSEAEYHAISLLEEQRNQLLSGARSSLRSHKKTVTSNFVLDFGLSAFFTFNVCCDAEQDNAVQPKVQV